MADPGFPGVPTPKVRDIIWPKFPRKLHENERIWTETGRGRASLAPPLDPPLISCFDMTYRADSIIRKIYHVCSINLAPHL